MGNPKTMVFYLALLPTLVDLAAHHASRLCGARRRHLGVLAVVFGAYIARGRAGAAALHQRRGDQALNRRTGAVMAGAAAAIASR